MTDRAALASSAEGIKSTALCPGFVDTPMTDFIKGAIPAETMMVPADVAESVRFLLRVSPARAAAPHD